MDEQEYVAELSASDEEVAPRRRRAADAALRKLSPPKRFRTKYSEELHEEIVAFAKQTRPRALTPVEKVDILLLNIELRRRFEEKKKKIGRAFRGKAPQYHEEVSQILRRGKRLVSETWKDFMTKKNIELSEAPGNRNSKWTFVPETRKVLRTLQQFMRERREIRERTVAKDILDCLVKNKFVCIRDGDLKAKKSALRSVQRYIVRKGFKRGRKKGCQHYRLKSENLLARDEYVLRMIEENRTKARRIVYMDESYIHKNYCRHDDSLYDPNDEQDLQTIRIHKGQRYCFIAAIVDADHRKEAKERTPYEKAHLMKETLHIFQGGSSKKKKKETKDYHGMFDFQYFKEWMSKLLDALDKRHIENAIIVMDNAKYHRNLPEGTPKSNFKKSVLQKACKEYGISFEPTETKAMLWPKLSEYVRKNIKPVVVSMAAARGHEVLFSPPHYSDLQPIEIVWAIVKGVVGRQYTTETTFQQVRERLEKAFQDLLPKTVQGCINKANSHLKRLYTHITKIELLEEAESDDNADESEDTDGSDEDDASNE
jgi:transposase